LGEIQNPRSGRLPQKEGLSGTPHQAVQSGRAKLHNFVSYTAGNVSYTADRFLWCRQVAIQFPAVAAACEPCLSRKAAKAVLAASGCQHLRP